MKKRLINLFAVTSLLVGFASCSDNNTPPPPGVDPEVGEILENLFGDDIPSYATDPAAAPVEVSGSEISTLPAFTAAYPWKVSVTSSFSRAASRADEVGFQLSQDASGANPDTVFSGSADKKQVQLYLVAPPKPEEGAISATVNVTVADQYGNIVTIPIYEAYVNSGVIEFAVYPGVASDSITATGVWQQDAEGNFIYATEAATSMSVVGTEGFGLSARFLVSSSEPWIIQGAKNLPFYFSVDGVAAVEGVVAANAGQANVLANVNEELQPIEDTEIEITFIENTESNNAATLGTFNIAVPGCGGTIAFAGRGLEAEQLMSYDGWLYANDNWMPLEIDGYYSPVQFLAAYGSKIFFASEGNWIDFIEPIEFETGEGDIYTKYGLQTVGAGVDAEINPDETTRTAYLIGIPASEVAALGDFDESAVIGEDGTLDAKFQPYVMSVITQKPNITESEAKQMVYWADTPSFGETTDGAADLTVLLTSNENYRYLFVGDWKNVPVAFGLSFTSIYGPGMVPEIVLPENTASVTFVDSRGQYAGEGSVVAWASAYQTELERNRLRVDLAYDFTTDEWEVDINDLIEDGGYLTGYFLLNDADGNIITFIQTIVNVGEGAQTPGTGDTPGENLIAGAWGYSGSERKSLGLKPLSDGSEGYDPDYSGQQYSLAMGDCTSVEFDKVPAGPTWVCDPDDPDENLSDVFVRQGETNFFTLDPPADASGKLLVSFEGAHLYITYSIEDSGLELLTYATSYSGPEITLTALSSGDSNYNQSLQVDHQYYVDLGDNYMALFNANEEVSNMVITLQSLTINSGADVSEKYTDAQGVLNTTDLSFDWNGISGTLYLPDSSNADVETTVAGTYHMVFILSDGTNNVSLTIDVEVI